MSNHTRTDISDQIVRLTHNENGNILVLTDWGEGVWNASYRKPVGVGKERIEYELINTFDPSNGLSLDEVILRFDQGTL